MLSHLITANRVTDGVVIFRTKDGAWSEKLGDAWFTENDAEADTMLQAAQGSARHDGVVEPYLVEADVRDGHAVPKRMREAIRADGPTTHPEFRKI
jgi:hypothetical protein